MIIVALKGGLGNQLFQYACGKALALRTNNAFALDISGYGKNLNSDTPRYYTLSKFNVDFAKIASDEEIRRCKYPYDIFSKSWRLIKAKILRKFYISFNERFFKKINRLDSKKDIYLDGFWQTEKYFIDKADIIRKDFTLKDPLSPGAQEILNMINGRENDLPSVSIHVRRGDVVRDAKTNPYYGICTPEYYTEALDYMKKELGEFKVFVFSEDTEWVRKNISIFQPTVFVSDVKGIKDYEELVLMSKCDHNIIANSSFSWWSAWLNENKNKIVVTPSEWITRGKWHHKDTIPLSWIRL
jgi:hypothetical protein